MRIKEIIYDFFSTWKKVKSISVKFTVLNKNLDEISSTIQKFEMENPLENVYKDYRYEMTGWDVSKAKMEKSDVELRKIAKDFLNNSQKKKRVENKFSIFETKIIKGVKWELEDYEKEYLSYDEYLELKTKGALN